MTTPPPQGHDQLVISAPADTIWAIIEDTAQLPAWVPMVEGVDVPAGRREHIGAVRTCQVRISGRRGQITERCTNLVAGRRADYVWTTTRSGLPGWPPGSASPSSWNPSTRPPRP